MCAIAPAPRFLEIDKPGGQRSEVLDPLAAIGSGERGPFPFDLLERECLGQGDSWCTAPLDGHNHARVMFRPGSAGLAFVRRLLPALDRHDVPPADGLAVADQLPMRLLCLMDDLVAARRARDPLLA